MDLKVKNLIFLVLALVLAFSVTACKSNNNTNEQKQAGTEVSSVAETSDASQAAAVSDSQPAQSAVSETQQATKRDLPSKESVSFDSSWEYGDYSIIHTDSATLYRSRADKLKNKVICVNAGHGCKGGSSVKTFCHPDKTPKVTGGSTAAGSIKATSISEGTVLKDGTEEADANLALAKLLKNVLLENGYDVLMIRENTNTQLDNIARTLIANNNADCHISLHYDSSTNDKGLFFIGVPDIKSYRNIEPVKSHFEEHTRLGESIVEGERRAGVKIYRDGRMDIDLTQTSYSTVPSVDIEVGDEGSDHSLEQHKKLAEGMLTGIDIYFGFQQ